MTGQAAVHRPWEEIDLLCQDCRQRPATVKIVAIVDNQQTEVHLCEECARKRGEVEFGSEGQLSLGEMLAAFLHHQAASSNAEPAGPVPEPCPACGLTYERLVHTGKLGCGECFRHFGPQVERILRHVHGNVRHAGRSPRRGGGPLQVTLRVARLKRELAACVQAEDFERAAVLRDEIRALEGVPAGAPPPAGEPVRPGDEQA